MLLKQRKPPCRAGYNLGTQSQKAFQLKQSNSPVLKNSNIIKTQVPFIVVLQYSKIVIIFASPRKNGFFLPLFKISFLLLFPHSPPSSHLRVNILVTCNFYEIKSHLISFIFIWIHSFDLIKFIYYFIELIKLFN